MAAEVQPFGERAAGRLLAAELELEAKGIPQALARAAVRRADNYAWGMAVKLPADMRERAYQAYLDSELLGAEAWCQRWQESVGR